MGVMRDKAVLDVKAVTRMLIDATNSLFTGDRSREWWREFLAVTVPRSMENIANILRLPMNAGFRPSIEDSARKLESHIKDAQRIFDGGVAPPYKPNGHALAEAIQEVTTNLSRLESDPGFADEAVEEMAPVGGGSMLKRIYVHNYRTLVNFEWSPPRACVLVGDNGAGKSALVETLWLLQDVVVEGKRFEETGFPSTLTAWLKEPEQTIEIDLESGAETFRYRLGYRTEKGRGTIREELSANGAVLYKSADAKVELFGEPPPSVPRTTIPFDRTRSFLPVLEPRSDNRRISAFREAIRSMWAIKPDPRKLGAAAVGEAACLDRDLANFADWYRARMPEDPDAAAALRKDLERALTGFAQLRLEPISPEIKDLRVRFSFGNKTHELGWAKLSDGQRLLVALYGFFRFAISKAGLLILDEIENYIAPAEVQPWLRLVSDAAAEGSKQLIVVSHHPESINYMAADAVWRMWRDPTAGHSRIEQVQPDRDAGESAYDVVKLGQPDAT